MHDDALLYDAFISYASESRKAARWLQANLEAFRTPGVEPLKAFLDLTDLRGGTLGAELRAALARSKTLVICASPEAAARDWVRQEITFFLESNPQGRIAIAWVSGRDIDACVPQPLSTRTTRYHDLRHWCFGVMPRPGVTIELRKLLAFVADVRLRSVIDWDRRRRLRRRLVTGCVATFFFLAAGYLIYDGRLDAAARSNLALAVQAETAGLGQREIAHASRPIRKRAIQIALQEQSRAESLFHSPWPAAAAGLDEDLASDLLPPVRDAMATSIGESSVAPLVYRHLLWLVDSQAVLGREAAALLQQIPKIEEPLGASGVYVQRERRKQLLEGLIALLRKFTIHENLVGDLAATLEQAELEPEVGPTYWALLGALDDKAIGLLGRKAGLDEASRLAWLRPAVVARWLASQGLATTTELPQMFSPSDPLEPSLIPVLARGIPSGHPFWAQQLLRMQDSPGEREHLDLVIGRVGDESAVARAAVAEIGKGELADEALQWRLLHVIQREDLRKSIGRAAREGFIKWSRSTVAERDVNASLGVHLLRMSLAALQREEASEIALEQVEVERESDMLGVSLTMYAICAEFLRKHPALAVTERRKLSDVRWPRDRLDGNIAWIGRAAAMVGDETGVKGESKVAGASSAFSNLLTSRLLKLPLVSIDVPPVVASAGWYSSASRLSHFRLPAIAHCSPQALVDAISTKALEERGMKSLNEALNPDTNTKLAAAEFRCESDVLRANLLHERQQWLQWNQKPFQKTLRDNYLRFIPYVEDKDFLQGEAIYWSGIVAESHDTEHLAFAGKALMAIRLGQGKDLTLNERRRVAALLLHPQFIEHEAVLQWAAQVVPPKCLISAREFLAWREGTKQAC